MISHWKANAPQAPYYAVIFISKKSSELEGYPEMDERMMQLVQEQDGYLGYSSKGDEKEGIFISYWRDQESIAKWRANLEHGSAKTGAKTWYAYYHSMICKVESSNEHGTWLEMS
jgi:heme-degrading monooxygenase HmoA